MPLALESQICVVIEPDKVGVFSRKQQMFYKKKIYLPTCTYPYITPVGRVWANLNIFNGGLSLLSPLIKNYLAVKKSIDSNFLISLGEICMQDGS